MTLNKMKIKTYVITTLLIIIIMVLLISYLGYACLTLKESLEHVETEKKSLEKRINIMSSNYDTLLKEYEKVRSELLTAQHEIANLVNELRLLEDKYNSLKISYAELLELYNITKEKYDMLKLQVNPSGNWLDITIDYIKCYWNYEKVEVGVSVKNVGTKPLNEVFVLAIFLFEKDNGEIHVTNDFTYIDNLFINETNSAEVVGGILMVR